MKHTLLALGAAAALGLFTLLLVPGLHRATAGSLGEEARLAIDVRCGEADGGAARACRTRLERLYAAGALEPDRTLRLRRFKFKFPILPGNRANPNQKLKISPGLKRKKLPNSFWE